jgi:1,4-dihydroxy-6-naphthoate synthase
MEERVLTLGHSPDPDDAFMFYALAAGRIPAHGFRFEHVLQDIQTLNERALRGELDISAISFHAWAYVGRQYALLPAGASMGDGYGPLVVAREQLTKAQVASVRIAVPGRMTSAFLALQLWLGLPATRINHVVVPFDQVFSAIHAGHAQAGLLIHEGQLTWDKEGLAVCADLGAWWKGENEGLPLPLGGNVIHKRIAPADRRQVTELIRASIQYALDHRDEAVHHALRYGRGLGPSLADRFVGMYVNQWSLDYGEKGREAIRRFLGQGRQQGLLPAVPELEFVE